MSDARPPRVYFDSSVYIAHFLDELGKGDVADVALTGAVQGHSQAFISSLVVAEVSGAPKVRAPQGANPRVGREASRRIAAFVDTLPFVFVEGGRKAGQRAADLAADHQLKGPDALHLALAEVALCSRFFTFDQDQLKVGKLGSMMISEPKGRADGELPLGDPQP